jgi:cytochrome b6-f complex subunit 7
MCYAHAWQTHLGDDGMNSEIFNAAVLSSTLILVGLGLGFLLLKIQGGEEEL